MITASLIAIAHVAGTLAAVVVAAFLAVAVVCAFGAIAGCVLSSRASAAKRRIGMTSEPSDDAHVAASASAGRAPEV
jgi:hypothetical protein